jgi:phosphoglycerol transferase MdoB-like AlkP superfamily enzyme
VRRIVLVFAANLAVFTLLRILFYVAFRGTAAPVPGPELLHAFYLGLKFDARLAAIVVFPLLFIRGRVWLAAAESLVLLLYAADFGSYAYIHQRVNADELELLRNPLIAWHMVWESYHVVLFALAIAAVIAAFLWSDRRPRLSEREDRRGRLSLHRYQRLALALLLLACIYGKLSRYPLRWSDAYDSRSTFAAQLALNPPQFLFETMREEPAALDVRVVEAVYPQIASYLGVVHPHPLDYRRTPPVHPITSGTPNVVLIQLESFAAFKSGVFGNRASATPSFDAVARGGVLFTNAYTPSEKTARALFAVVFGIPDVSPWQASAHNPLAVDQATIVNAFRGWDKLYFLGGSANWSNIRGMLAHNIDGLRIYEEGSYAAKPVDVWGISDEDLFRAANDVFRRERRPFFAIIQTSGNHRPYTVPRSFPRAHVPAGEGFESDDEYNSLRYMDHALGLFFANARREPYFANTIFVLYGDHGTRTGAPREALALGDLALLVYHVPLVFYAPALLAPRRTDVAASHLDILPTLASMCGRPYVDQTLGVDLFAPPREPAAFLFTTFHEPPDLGLVRGGRYTMVKARTRPAGGDGALAYAFYETSRWMLLHNGTTSVYLNDR